MYVPKLFKLIKLLFFKLGRALYWTWCWTRYCIWCFLCLLVAYAVVVFFIGLLFGFFKAADGTMEFKMTRYLEVFFLLFSHIYLFIGSLYKSAYNFLYSVYKFFEPVYIFFVHVYHFFVHVYYFLVDVFYSWYFLFIAKDYPLLLLFSILVTFIPLLGSVALFTLAERKVIATVQRRRGPNVVGTWGLLQPFADGLKLVIKETTVPNRAMTSLFLIAPSISFVLSVFGWCIIPLHANFESKPLVFADLNLGLL